MMLFVWLTLVAYGLAELLVVALRLVEEVVQVTADQRAEWAAAAEDRR